MKRTFAILLFITFSSATFAETPGQKELQKGESGYFLCEKNSDCSPLAETYRCVSQKYACGPAATCGEKVCVPQAVNNETEQSAETSQAVTVPAHERATQRAFKGYELYSWTEHGEWKFSLLLGTNRNKSADEIRQLAPISGIAALKEALGRLAVGESVSWFNTGAERLTYPPTEIVSDLKQFAGEKGIRLFTR